MLKIGLTGGIGSGKTTVAQIFEVLGVPVYYADQAARELMNQNEELKEAISTAFGAAVYSGGKLDRSRLARIVFTDPEKLGRLNAIVHPVTRQNADAWMRRQTTPYAIKEAAIIFETGLEKYLDLTIGVQAPESLRLERVIKRDDTSREKVLQRMGQQMNEADKMSRCNFVIVNNGQQAVLPQVLAIHEKILAQAGPIR